jgi:hypothetical protein
VCVVRWLEFVRWLVHSCVSLMEVEEVEHLGHDF